MATTKSGGIKRSQVQQSLTISALTSLPRESKMTDSYSPRHGSLSGVRPDPLPGQLRPDTCIRWINPIPWRTDICEAKVRCHCRKVVACFVARGQENKNGVRWPSIIIIILTLPGCRLRRQTPGAKQRFSSIKRFPKCRLAIYTQHITACETVGIAFHRLVRRRYLKNSVDWIPGRRELLKSVIRALCRSQPPTAGSYRAVPGWLQPGLH
ncbi:hypothetical protein Bbelb_250430 [Branchiostoma belcheri]|nr:hypothetical protein Bbelb_250430 [Branchiostoma belcheri]